MFPALTAIEGLELLPQIPEGETLLNQRERKKVSLRDPP
jgi:hypothetical protein